MYTMYILYTIYYIILCYIILYHIILHYITLYYIILNYIKLYYIILYCIIYMYIYIWVCLKTSYPQFQWLKASFPSLKWPESVKSDIFRHTQNHIYKYLQIWRYRVQYQNIMIWTFKTNIYKYWIIFPFIFLYFPFTFRWKMPNKLDGDWRSISLSQESLWTPGTDGKGPWYPLVN